MHDTFSHWPPERVTAQECVRARAALLEEILEQLSEHERDLLKCFRGKHLELSLMRATAPVQEAGCDMLISLVRKYRIAYEGMRYWKTTVINVNDSSAAIALDQLHESNRHIIARSLIVHELDELRNREVEMLSMCPIVHRAKTSDKYKRMRSHLRERFLIIIEGRLSDFQ